MNSEFREVLELLAEFVRLSFRDRIDSFHLLTRAGNRLVDFSELATTSSARIFIAKRIAYELFEVTEAMGHIKKYDASQLISQNYELAFKLALIFCKQQPNRELLPFLGKIMYYQNYGKFGDIETDYLYQESLNDLSLYTENLLKSKRPWYDAKL